MFHFKYLDKVQNAIAGCDCFAFLAAFFRNTKDTKNSRRTRREPLCTLWSFVFQKIFALKHSSILSALLFLSVFAFSQTLTSPDKKIEFSLHTWTQNSQLSYAIRFNGMPVIELSPLGIDVDKFSFGKGAEKGTTTFYKENETYPFRGIHNRAVNRYNGMKASFTSRFRPFTIEVRVYNDGVAFRYIIPKKDSAIITSEETGFTIPASSIVWSQNNIKYYEGRYTKKLVDTIKQGDLMGPPITIELPANAGYAAITEGGLTDFGGMSLKALSNVQLQANLSGITKKYGVIETPWRIIQIGKDLNTLVNCDIIANVSPAYDKKLFPKGYATDWVKPGRSVWSWLAKGRSVTLENMKHFSDLASQLGFEYNLVDEGWGRWKDSANGRDHWDMMKELVDYSAAKGVKIWVWKAYPNRAGIPGIFEEAARKQFFQKCKDIGVVGLKIDFFDSENQEIINFYQAALRDAAQYQLMINFHGANKPTGETRSFPNEMTREAIRGMENRPPWAQSNTVLPFTRYLAGHADYTPIHFGDRAGEVSWSHHVASAVVFTSPLLCYGADPQSILDHPAKEMIQSIPPVWDETIVLPQSKIGELVLYARRKGNVWFLAAMNGVHEPKAITVDLSFLKAGNYALSVMKDEAEKQAAAQFEASTVNAKSKITINLNPEGGFIGRFTKTN